MLVCFYKYISLHNISDLISEKTGGMKINQLNTANLKSFEIEDVLQKLKKYLYEIKNKDHDGELFYLKYWNSEENIVIDINSFIDSSIVQAITDYKKIYKQDYYEKSSFIRETLKSRSYEYIIIRLRNNFQLTEGSPRKILNEFLSYIKQTVYSAVTHYFRDVEKAQQKYDMNLVNESYSDEIEKEFEAGINITGYNSRDPLQIIIDDETSSKVETILNCIDQLPKKQKVALIENKISGRSEKEISLLLNNSQQAVSDLIKKAKKNLIIILNEKGMGDYLKD